MNKLKQYVNGSINKITFIARKHSGITFPVSCKECFIFNCTKNKKFILHLNTDAALLSKCLKKLRK